MTTVENTPKLSKSSGLLSSILFSKKIDNEKKEHKLKVLEESKKKEILRRQAKLLRNEINESWRIVFGDEVPKRKKGTFLINNITPRNIWMEDNFLYNQIKSFQPDEMFHKTFQYALKWQPPGSLFKLVIPLDNPQIQENALLFFSKFTSYEKKNTLFFFSPIDPNLSMYAEKVHPSSLVSYRTKNLILKKLCEIFLQGRLSVDEVQQILVCDQYVWSAALYNLLPEDEKVYHTYLNAGKPSEDTNKTISKSYIDGDISLKEYEDLKFPERKLLHEIEHQTYPLPYDKETCIICTRDNIAIVQCNTCTNMVCGQCMKTVFASGRANEKSTSFLLMHQKYCMKLGELPPIIPIVVDEVAYLREFRLTSRKLALEMLLPKKESMMIQEEELSEDEEEQEYQRKLAEEKARLLAAENERILRENPFSLRLLREQLNIKLKRLDRISKDVKEINDKINDKSRTDQYRTRNIRLRLETFDKLAIQVLDPVVLLQEQAIALNLTGEFIETFLKDVEYVKNEITVLSVDIS